MKLAGLRECGRVGAPFGKQRIGIMTGKNVNPHKKMIKEIMKRAKTVGKERDKIRDIISEWEMLADNCDEAKELLERAADELSQLV